MLQLETYISLCYKTDCNLQYVHSFIIVLTCLTHCYETNLPCHFEKLPAVHLSQMFPVLMVGMSLREL